MEIHAPHRPILSLKEALVHLCIVTAGILIALSLEGALEQWHHRELVRETRQNLQNEIRGNQDSIQTVLKSLDPTKTRFVHAIDVVSDLSASGTPKEAASIFAPAGGGLMSGTSFAWLNTASYKTAEATGALGLMEYSEAIKYSDIYDLQALYVRMQDGAERDMFAAYMLGTGILAKPAPAEITDVKRQLRLALAGILPMENLANKLNELYSRALKGAS
jgi:hypothetical protein